VQKQIDLENKLKVLVLR